MIPDSETSACPPGVPSVEEWLIDSRRAAHPLADATFDKASPNPGYSKGLVPVVRENGGQYTHAALWVVMAQALRRPGRCCPRNCSAYQPDLSIVRRR